jgi:uncharacterized membrane protein
MESNTDRWGEVRLTMNELTEITSMSRTTLWRALVNLTERGLVTTVRTKRNLGRLYKNVYKVVKVETSTADTSSQVNQVNSVNQVTTLTTLTIKVKNTSYSLVRSAHGGTKMVNKWNEEDGDLMGFGLVDVVAPTEKVKKVPKTRHLRPQEEWTAMDVASEFTAQVYDKVRGIPGLVNTQRLGIALATNRKKHGITATQEMQILQKFFADDRNLVTIKKFPKRTAGIFLNFITQNISEVSDVVTIETAIAMEDQLEYIYASDGRKFVRSISGRAELAQYEKQLKEE